MLSEIGYYSHRITQEDRELMSRLKCEEGERTDMIFQEAQAVIPSILSELNSVDMSELMVLISAKLDLDVQNIHIGVKSAVWVMLSENHIRLSSDRKVSLA